MMRLLKRQGVLDLSVSHPLDSLDAGLAAHPDVHDCYLSP